MKQILEDPETDLNLIPYTDQGIKLFIKTSKSLIKKRLSKAQLMAMSIRKSIMNT